MSNKRRTYSADFKFRIALEGMKGIKTIAQIASENKVHPNQVSKWKKQLQMEGSVIFKGTGLSKEKEWKKQEAELYEQIGRLKMEVEWLKKKVIH